MNALFMAPFIPSAPIDGDKLRALWTLQAISAKHRVFAFFLDPEGTGRIPGSVRSLCREAVSAPLSAAARAAGTLRGIVSGRPIGAEAFFDSSARETLSRALMGWPADFVHVHRLRMMPYALDLKIPRVLDATDCLTEYFRRAKPELKGVRRIYAAMELPRLRRYEREWCNKANSVIAITAAEAAKLRAIGVKSRLFVAPNGLDLDYWKPGKPSAERGRRLVFMGNLGYPPNEAGLTWFFDKVAPLLAPAAKGAVISILGQGASGRLLKCAARAGVRVAFKGYVQDPRPEFARSSAMVCPLRVASGLQNKALQAMAAGLPVISTRMVAKGLGAGIGREVMADDRPDGFAELCRRALEGDGKLKAAARRARRFVERRYDASKTAAKVLAACEAAAAAGPGTG